VQSRLQNLAGMLWRALRALLPNQQLETIGWLQIFVNGLGHMDFVTRPSAVSCIHLARIGPEMLAATMIPKASKGRSKLTTITAGRRGTKANVPGGNAIMSIIVFVDQI
jgi:hypothetical protein